MPINYGSTNAALDRNVHSAESRCQKRRKKAPRIIWWNESRRTFFYDHSTTRKFNLLGLVLLINFFFRYLQSTNEHCDEYNTSLMNSVSEFKNIYCFSTVFDGLSTETKFILSNLNVFMKGNSNTVVMIDCNHTITNVRSQLFLKSTNVIGVNALCDVYILRIAGISPELSTVTDYASNLIITWNIIWKVS